MSSYRIVFSKQDLGHRISTLYRQKQFSIGILDFGSKEDLTTALDWYLSNMNLSIHVLSTEFKMEQYDIAKDYPEVTFIVFKNDTTTGEFINAMADECYTAISYFSFKLFNILYLIIPSNCILPTTIPGAIP